MKKSLFNEKDETFTDAATELDSRASETLTPLFNEFLMRGYPAREIENVLGELVMEISLEARLNKRDPLEGEGPAGFGKKAP